MTVMKGDDESTTVYNFFGGIMYVFYFNASSADCHGSDIKHMSEPDYIVLGGETLSICYITRRSHRVSAWTPSQLRSQYGIAHRRHLYNPQYPQTEQIIRGGYAEGGAPAVRYVGTLDGKDAML